MDKSFDSGPIAVEIPFEINPKNTYGIVETNYGHVAINGVFQLLNSIL
jgi:methionyl-tRNA formyltransferase